MLRFFACPAIALATADRSALAENLDLMNRSEVPPSGGALNPNLILEIGSSHREPKAFSERL